MKKECLECKKEYEAERNNSKYCSSNCRVKYNRKHGIKKSVGKVELGVLYNSILELVEKLQRTPNSIDYKSSKMFFENVNEFEEDTAPEIEERISLEEYIEMKQECETKEDWFILSNKVKHDKYLGQGQKEFILKY